MDSLYSWAAACATESKTVVGGLEGGLESQNMVHGTDYIWNTWQTWHLTIFRAKGCDSRQLFANGRITEEPLQFTERARSHSGTVRTWFSPSWKDGK